MRHRIGRIAILWLASLAAAQNNKLKVYIAADMEGIGGVSTWDVQADAKGREYLVFNGRSAAGLLAKTISGRAPVVMSGTRSTGERCARQE